MHLISSLHLRAKKDILSLEKFAARNKVRDGRGKEREGGKKRNGWREREGEGGKEREKARGGKEEKNYLKLI